jgi:Right handed beta helix region
VVAFVALALSGFGAGIAFGIGKTASTVTQTVTQTVTVGGTLGTKLPARMPESSGSKLVYVSPTGSDSKAGTLAAPVKSLSKAFSLATSGTIIYARGNAGSFPEQSVVNHTYSASNPVTLTTYPGDAIATFVGPATLPSSATNAVHFEYITGMRIRHIKIDAPYSVTCLKIDSSNDVEVDNAILANCGASETKNGGQGILVGSATVNPWTPTHRFQFWNSTIYNWSNPIHDTGGHGHGMYLATVDNSVVANNVIYGVTSRVGMGIHLGNNANRFIITNNTIDGVVRRSGMVVWTGTSEGSEPTNGNLIVNNIFSNNGGYAIYGCGGPVPATPNIVRSNLSFNNTNGDYNPIGCIPSGNATFTVQSPGYTGNPLYVNRSARDYNLQAGSPALRKADPEYAPLLGKDGKARPASPALGAHN